MTQAHSELGDNGGLCEGCDDPATAAQVQRTYPVQLANFGPHGSAGWGTMWLCDACAEKRTHKFEISTVPQATRPAGERDTVQALALTIAQDALAERNKYAAECAEKSAQKDAADATPKEVDGLARLSAAYEAGRAAGSAVGAAQQKRIHTPHAPPTRTTQAIRCATCGETHGIDEFSHRELEYEARLVPAGWLVREERVDDYYVDRLAWCSVEHFRQYLRKQEVRSAWSSVRPRSADVALPEFVDAETRRRVGEAASADYAAKHGDACRAMAEAFGDDWRARGGLTDAETA